MFVTDSLSIISPQQKLDVATRFSFLFRRKQLSSVVGFFNVLTAN